MITSVATHSSAGPHVETLQEAMDREQTEVDCLIIAHNDPRMIRLLTDSAGNQTTAVLPLCQSEWDTNLGSILAWAVDAGIDHVVIAGHSENRPSVQTDLSATGQASDLSGQSRQSTDRLLGGVHRSQHQLARAKAAYANRISALLKCEELRDTECGDDFHLSLLFFIASGESFLRYSIKEGSFLPLL